MHKEKPVLEGETFQVFLHFATTYSCEARFSVLTVKSSETDCCQKVTCNVACLRHNHALKNLLGQFNNSTPGFALIKIRNPNWNMTYFIAIYGTSTYFRELFERKSRRASLERGIWVVAKND